MFTIDQEVANEIARTTPMKYPAMKALFAMTEEEADKWEMKLIREIEAKSDDTIARAVVAFLPLYLENMAITKFIQTTRQQVLRRMMPEILTAEEAALMAAKDRTMDDSQISQTAQLMKECQYLINNTSL